MFQGLFKNYKTQNLNKIIKGKNVRVRASSVNYWIYCCWFTGILKYTLVLNMTRK